MIKPTTAWITLDNTITMDGETETIGIEVEGTFSYSDAPDAYALTYVETDEDGSSTSVAVLLGAELVAITRKGPIRSLMRLAMDKRETFQVETPMGTITADTELCSCVRKKEGDRYRFDLRYRLYFGPGEPAEHRMTITVKPS